MADLKISQLTSATLPLAGTEVLPIVQSNSTKKVATDDLTVKNLRSNATTGLLQVAGPNTGNTCVMTTPDANFVVARTDAAQTFTGDQKFLSGNIIFGANNASPAGTPAQLANQWFGGAKWGASFDQTDSSATSYTHINFSTAGATVGYISANNSATTYNSISDYRLKENPQPLTDSGFFIDSLKPKTWLWKIDGRRGVGFIAHEVQEVSPSSVVGEKDGKQMQAMEYGSAEFIANIVAELQSLRVRVAALENK